MKQLGLVEVEGEDDRGRGLYGMRWALGLGEFGFDGQRA